MVRSIANRLRLAHSNNALDLPCNFPAVDPSKLGFAQASEWPEVRGAFRLLYENYRDRGLIPPNRLELRYTQFNLLPESATFVAQAEDQVVATVSLIVDSRPFGLPMDDLYAAELDPLRASGHKLAEISGLAVDSRYHAHSLTLLMHLIKLFLTYAQKLDVTDLVIACHPKHSRLYKRLFLFQDLGGYRSYGPLNDAPAVAVRLGVGDVEDRYRRAYDADGFNIYTFFFTDDVFRCPDAALRVQAFTSKAYQELLDLRPAVEAELERGSPGLVKRLAGRPSPVSVQVPGETWAGLAWDLQPAFVAA